MFTLHKIAGILFIVYLLFMEFAIYKRACRYCYYYGKRCVAGKGNIVPLFFKKGEAKKFCERKVSAKEFVPHLLISFIPIIAGIYLLIKDFTWLILGLMLWPLIVNFIGNPILYGKIACPHCKQGAKCCPACEFFMKKKTTGKKK